MALSAQSRSKTDFRKRNAHYLESQSELRVKVSILVLLCTLLLSMGGGAAHERACISDVLSEKEGQAKGSV